MAPTHESTLKRYRDLVHHIRTSSSPSGEQFDACRAVLATNTHPETTLQALTMLLEGALADATLSIDATQDLVPLLKLLARGEISPEELL